MATRRAAQVARANISQWVQQERDEAPELPDHKKTTNHAPKAGRKREDEQRLSKYELARLDNIRRNQAFMSAIKLCQAKEELMKPQRVLKRKPKETPEREVLPPRKSDRLQKKKAPLIMDIKHIHHPLTKKRRGPCLMEPLNVEQGKRLPPELIMLYTEEPVMEEKVELNWPAYQASLQNMTLTRDAKLVPRTLHSAAFHPNASTLLAAAGNSQGHVALWSIGGGWGDDGMLLFEPHTGIVGCMAFSKTHPANLLSLSYDGSLRCMDVEKAVFDEVYDTEDALKSFDFLSHDCSTLAVGHLDGDLAIVDRRAKGTSRRALYALDTKEIHCVNVHPVHQQYILVAETNVVSIYDSRYLQDAHSSHSLKKKNRSLSQLCGHSKSVITAYFSPSTGNRVLTSCKDSVIRVYDTSSVTSTDSLLPCLRLAKSNWHRRGAVWDPKQDDCFAVSSMSWPHSTQVFHHSGELLHSFLEAKPITVLAFHPSRNALLGGDHYGNLHVSTD